MNTKAKGYLLGAVAAATYGMNPLFALPLYKAGMDPDSVLFFRYLFAIPLLGTMLKARGRDFKLHRREIVPLVLLGLLVALSSLSLFLSYNYMDAGIASTLLFVYPIFVALIMAFGFREKLSPQTALCILLALARYRAVVQRQRWFDAQYHGNGSGDGFGFVLRNLYRRREPPVLKPLRRSRCRSTSCFSGCCFTLSAGLRHGSPCAR